MKKKKGGKSKGKKNKKTSEKEEKDVLPEVDKEHYEIQISDLTLKLSRLRGRNAELNGENIDLRQRYEQLDEDRADIIAHLTRLLDEKTRECEELQDRLEALEKLREQDHEDFSAKISSMQQEYNIMHTKLQADIKLLKGKLNSLEEFRQAKEELMRKFQEQEEKFQQQEKRHDDQLYEKELEKRLLQLSADFQTTFQLRIASHTQRVIRENVAVNNELGTLMTSWKHIMDENLALKQDNTKLRLELSHVTATRDEIHRSNLRKQQLMLDLKENYMKMKQSYAQITAFENQNAALSEQVDHWKAKHNQAYSQLTKLSEQMKEQSQKTRQEDVALHSTKHELDKLQRIVHQAATAIKHTVEVQPSEKEAESKKSERTKLILSLLDILNCIHHGTDVPQGRPPPEVVSMATLSQYQQGSLGIIPKPGGD
ncbi:hypothetical protein M8J76_009533 [Diaphorina citri]|nr:hypothetical protein M8J75_002947 [Diaphorina citri]KAI5741013.1 hypothetical protein M8J76_009533 [Diaphorina citri]